MNSFLKRMVATVTSLSLAGMSLLAIPTNAQTVDTTTGYTTSLEYDSITDTPTNDTLGFNTVGQTETVTYQLGDLDFNGEVNVLDCLLLKKNLLFGTNDSLQIAVSDLNSNGGIDAVDLLIIKQYVLRIIDTLGTVDVSTTTGTGDVTTTPATTITTTTTNTTITDPTTNATTTTIITNPTTVDTTTNTTTTITTTEETTTTTESTTEEVVIPQPTIYYASDAEISQGVTETVNAGYTGDSYVNLDNLVGSYINWTVEVPSSGNYELTFRYANGGSNDRPVNISTNGSEQYAYVNFPKTSSFTDWSTQTVVVYLNEGTNTIKLTSAMSDGASNIDYLTLTSTDKLADTLITPPKEGARQVESLDRGVCAANTGNGVLVSWRILGTDDENTTFKLYKNGQTPPIYEGTINEATCYLDTEGTADDWYTIDTYVNGVMTEFAQASINLTNVNSGTSGAYMDVPLDIPADQTMPDGTTCTYSANDCSVGDVDGDGQYEIIVKWMPSNSTDNTNIGYTGTTILDCYKLDGTKLWRIDLGINIRSGPHYTQFMVYDFDGDGKAELICKTSDGTTDGTGTVIGDATADYRTNNGTTSHGILTGSEFLTLFDGETGKALDTINYEPARGNISDWGDNYGNRVDRYLAGVAYLDGTTPSAIFCRGYYTRMAIVSYDVVDKKLVRRWTFDTGFDSSSEYYGQGNHSLAVADIDQDGKDEIVYGGCAIDDDGTGMYSTGYGHGDAMHVGDLVPDRDGLEVFTVHEEEGANYGASLRDAATGEILWKIDATEDTGRGIAGNFTDKYPGMLFTSVADNKLYYYDTTTNSMVDTGESWSIITKWGMNSMVWWTGDLEREALDRSMVDKYGVGRVFTGDGVTYNNGSKSNACLTCDLFGDWREEIIMRTTDDKYLRIFSTTYTTDYALTTLMHDTQYRCGVAIENVGYNQPPNTSFFLGTGYDLPEKPNVYTP